MPEMGNCQQWPGTNWHNLLPQLPRPAATSLLRREVRTQGRLALGTGSHRGTAQKTSRLKMLISIFNLIPVSRLTRDSCLPVTHEEVLLNC